MALSTYSELKTSIIKWLGQGDELNDDIDDFIDLAESRHRTEVRFRDMIVRTTLAIAAGDRYVDLPSDFLDPRFLRILNPNAGGRRYLCTPPFVNDEKMAERSHNTDGPASVYTIHEQIEFDREADQAYTAEFFYYKQLEVLSDQNESNELLVRAPDLYLYASLSAAEPFLLNDERVATWETTFVNRRDALNAQQIKSRHGGPQTARLRGRMP